VPPRPASTSQVPDSNTQRPPNPQNIAHSFFNNIPFPPPPPPGHDIRMQLLQAARNLNPGQPGAGVMGLQGQTPLNPQANIPRIPPWLPNYRAPGPQAPLDQAIGQTNEQNGNREQTGQQGPHPTPTINASGNIGFGNNLNNQPGSWRIQMTQTTIPTNLPHNGPPLVQAFATPQQLHQNNLQNIHLSRLGQFSNLQNIFNQTMPTSFQPRSTFLQPSPDRVTPMVYLLTTPRGPEALLLSPNGAFATNGYSSHANIGWNGSNTPDISTGRWGLGTQSGDTQPTANVIPQEAQPAQLNNQAEPDQPDQQDQVGDLLRILLPLGGHLWLLVRLCGFVYLFSSGGGWRNTIILGICAAIIFAAQTHMFDPLIQYIWNPIRQHVEELIHSEQPIPAADRNTDPNGQSIPATPQQMAERLLQERRAQQSPIRRALTQAERSTALFLASLVPGVGERQIAAREEAERRQREQEETARREEEERERQRLEAESSRTDENGQDSTDAKEEAQAPEEQSNQSNSNES
jgi:hypothetical protein